MKKVILIGAFMVLATIGGMQTASANDRSNSHHYRASHYVPHVDYRFVSHRRASRIHHRVQRPHRLRLHHRRAHGGLRHNAGSRLGFNVFINH